MNEPNIPGTLLVAKSPWVRWLMHGIGGGAAVTLGLAAIEAVKQRPEFLPQLLGGNFLFFGALITGMVVADRRLQQYGELQARQVAAQEQLAANVGVLAARGDSQAETTAAAMRYLAKQNEEILAKLLHIETGRLSGPESLHDA